MGHVNGARLRLLPLDGAAIKDDTRIVQSSRFTWNDIAGTFTNWFANNQDATGAASALANEDYLIR